MPRASCLVVDDRDANPRRLASVIGAHAAVTAGIRTSTRKRPACSLCAHRVVDAALRRQPLPQQLEPEADAARPRADRGRRGFRA